MFNEEPEHPLVGKRVEVKNVKFHDGTTGTVVGVLDYAGMNFWGNRLQVTIDRTPFDIRSLKDISLYVDNMTIFKK